MPIIKSAQKKLRKDKKRTTHNAGIKKNMKKAVKGATAKNTAKVHSAIDKAAKKKIIHKNKAARLKSRVSKLARAKK